jgi:hypothetical protein
MVREKVPDSLYAELCKANWKTPSTPIQNGSETQDSENSPKHAYRTNIHTHTTIMLGRTTGNMPPSPSLLVYYASPKARPF